MKEKNDDKKKKVTMTSFIDNLKKTYKYTKGGRIYLLFFLLFNLIMSGLSVIIPIVTAKRLIYLTSEVWKNLVIATLVIFGLEIFYNIIRFLSNWAYNKFFYDARKNIQLNLIEETLRITQNNLNNTSSGVFIERIGSDTDNITDIFSNLIDYVLNIMSSIGILISTIFINPYIFLFYLLFCLLTYFYNKNVSQINYNNRKEWKKSREKTGGFISEIVRGAKDIKILNAEKSFINTANKYIEETNDISYKYQRKRAFYRLWSGNISDISDLFITILLIYMLYSGNITLASILIIYNYHYRIMYLSKYLEDMLEMAKQYDLASDRIFGILENIEFEKEEFGVKKLKNIDGYIEFKDVFFGYEDNIDVLKGINFKIDANETVAFVGSSGAGKSTIFNLISYLNKPKSGTITFDGIDINELDKSSIRGNLSVISQNPYIYNMTIKENLKIIKNNCTMSEIEAACKLACLDDFINSLPNKYDTVIGEGGVTLSGGQKQRLAIARALLLKTKIILFDEATSALDNITQSKIQEAINNMKNDYTILIVAHRITTIMNASKIYVIDNGKVVGCGTHSYLLKNNDVYKRLYSQELSKQF